MAFFPCVICQFPVIISIIIHYINTSFIITVKSFIYDISVVGDQHGCKFFALLCAVVFFFYHHSLLQIYHFFYRIRRCIEFFSRLLTRILLQYFLCRFCQYGFTGSVTVHNIYLRVSFFSVDKSYFIAIRRPYGR